jgi:hypothetical protein
MSKPGGDHPSGISLGDALRLTKRHPACRRREAQPGSCMERENLDGDAKDGHQNRVTYSAQHERNRRGHSQLVPLKALDQKNARCQNTGLRGEGSLALASAASEMIIG